MRRGVSARTLAGLTRRARPRGKAGDPFLLLRNMLRLAQQRGCFSEPVPLQGVPSLKLNINSKQKLCFYNLAVHLPEGRRPQTGSQSQPQESEMSESWQRKTERQRERQNPVNWCFERTWRTFVFTLLLCERVQLPAQRLLPLLSICARKEETSQ